MPPMDPDGTATVKTDDAVVQDEDDDSSDSSESSSASTSSSDTPEDPELSKAALRAKIREQAGSLLSSKGPSSSSILKTGNNSSSSGNNNNSSKSRLVVSPPPPLQEDEPDTPVKKTSPPASTRNIANSALLAAGVVGAGTAAGVGMAAAAREPSEGSFEDAPVQKTGEQSQEKYNRTTQIMDDYDNDSTMNDSKRSVVRFEDEVMWEDNSNNNMTKPTTPTEIRFAEDVKKPPVAPRHHAALAAATTADDEEEEDEESGNVGQKSSEAGKVPPPVTSNRGFLTGAILFVFSLLIWAVALPIALVNRDDTADEAVTSPTLPPTTMVPTTNNNTNITITSMPSEVTITTEPTMAPSTLPPTITPSLEIDFPNYTLDAMDNPTSPQAMALEWMTTDPMVSTYDEARKLQRFALATFYYSTNGAEWTNNNNWLSVEPTMHECFWYAQAPVCNDQQQYTVLELNDNNIRGALPPELALLTGLRQIHLQRNRINASIPVTLSELVQMEILDLQQNKMTGPIPSELGLLTNLRLLWLNATRSTLVASTPAVTIPSELGLLTNLTELHLSSNSLEGTVPSELAKLLKLDWLSLRQNKLSGAIPSELALMPRLAWLDLAENALDSSIPTTLAWLNNTLRILQLEVNQLNGTIPDSLGRLTNVRQVWLQDNLLTGSVPPTLCYFRRIGKVEFIWVDCDEVICTCCICDDIEDVTGEEEVSSTSSPLAEYGATPVMNSANRANTSNVTLP